MWNERGFQTPKSNNGTWFEAWLLIHEKACEILLPRKYALLCFYSDSLAVTLDDWYNCCQIKQNKKFECTGWLDADLNPKCESNLKREIRKKSYSRSFILQKWHKIIGQNPSVSVKGENKQTNKLHALRISKTHERGLVKLNYFWGGQRVDWMLNNEYECKCTLVPFLTIYVKDYQHMVHVNF